jgi:DHA1 family bicyclomycin/chloramphenicol resistance-like MFS transporter
MQPTFLRNALILGLVSAIGPFAIDMYLPALPTIAADLDASTAATQMSLTSFFAAVAVCQLLYGPLTDMIGRKPTLYAGLSLFVAASVGCALAPSIEWLIAFRFVQGVGACAGMVVPRAVIRDLHTGLDATRLMSLIMLVFSVSPILAPLLGSALIVPFGWRAVFVGVTAAGLASLIVLALLLPETHPPEARLKSTPRTVLAAYGLLLRDRRFLGLTFIGGLGMASFFVFLASSSFIYIEHFGLTPTQYSLAFSINAVGFIGASQFSARLAMRFGFPRVITVAVACFMAMSLSLFGLTLVGADGLAVLIVMLFLAFAGLGLVIPSTMVLALDDHGPIAGMASALGGTLQMGAGALTIVATSAFFDGTTMPMVATIALCSVGAFALTRLTLGGERRAASPARLAAAGGPPRQ